MAMLKVLNLCARIQDKEILKGVTLLVAPGEVHAIMGPNGSGKSTFAQALAGHPAYQVTDGVIQLFGSGITDLPADERAHRGLFLAFQHPVAIPGISIANMLRISYNSIARAQDRETIQVPAFRELLTKKMQALRIPKDFADRSVNDGFSGGERKKLELLQAMVLEPRLLVCDEIDSGLDIDALKVVARGINHLRGKDRGIILMTHYKRILDYVKPDHVHIFVGGKIVKSGDSLLANAVEQSGYDTE